MYIPFHNIAMMGTRKHTPDLGCFFQITKFWRRFALSWVLLGANKLTAAVCVLFFLCASGGIFICELEYCHFWRKEVPGAVAFFRHSWVFFPWDFRPPSHIPARPRQQCNCLRDWRSEGPASLAAGVTFLFHFHPAVLAWASMVGRCLTVELNWTVPVGIEVMLETSLLIFIWHLAPFARWRKARWYASAFLFTFFFCCVLAYFYCTFCICIFGPSDLHF